MTLRREQGAYLRHTAGDFTQMHKQILLKYLELKKARRTLSILHYKVKLLRWNLNNIV